MCAGCVDSWSRTLTTQPQAGRFSVKRIQPTSSLGHNIGDRRSHHLHHRCRRRLCSCRCPATASRSPIGCRPTRFPSKVRSARRTSVPYLGLSAIRGQRACVAPAT
ncbi:hypothetical protein J6590_000170 [Homalodisca vitripennis]|nr:hypothetical protein J6590_000170 [Homalodisca vitripennis]